MVENEIKEINEETEAAEQTETFKEEKKLDMAALEDEAFAAIEDIVIKTY